MKKNVSVGILFIAVIAFFIILFSITVFQNNLEKKLTIDIYSRLSELSENNANSISTKITDQFEMLKALSSYIADEDLNGPLVLSLMNKTVDAYDFLRCAITFSDGSFITHDKKNSGNALLDEYVIKGFQGISSVTGPRAAVVDPTKTVILLSVPIEKEGVIIAVLTCTYETHYLNKVFKMTSFNGQGYSYIIDKEGRIISSPEIDETIYQGENLLDFFKEQFSDPMSYETIITNIDHLNKGSTRLNIDGNDKYINYQPLGINDWYVFSLTSDTVLEIQLNTILNDVFALSMTIMITLIILSILVGLYIISIQYKAKKNLQQLAYYDDLTLMPNKNLFEKEASEILKSSTKDYAYIILNVNKFKNINDIFGIAQGDCFLIHIAKKIQEETKENETCARFDADNFHLLYFYSSDLILEERLLNLSKRICDYPFDNDIYHALSVGFGVYVIQNKNKQVSLMGDKARMALSEIKGCHHSQAYFYNDSLVKQLAKEQEIENTMERALENEEMQLYLQGKYSIHTYELVGAEALVRWERPSKGILMPDHFIPLFEKNGFIIKLDMYMVELTCQKLKKWQEEEIKTVPISVNQSRQCLYHPHYISELTEILNRYNISPKLIELEITERAFFEDETTLIKIIQELHALDFSVSMDDFGTGYSSLNMLQDVDVDVLKIDKNFFKESIHSQRGKKIVSNIISMAKDLDIKVIAEGIETKKQVDFLKSIHCDFVQGYFFSKPVHWKEFEETSLSAKKEHN